MPESPEVREYYNFIKPILLNKTINNIKILSGKYQKNKPTNWDILEKKIYNKNYIISKKNYVSDITVKGKTIFIEISIKNDFIWLSFTHGMTGWWDIEFTKHSRISFELENNITLYYNDTRNFGKMSIYIDKIDYENAINHLGPNVLDENLTYNEFYSRIDKKPRSKIGAVLLDQKLIAGIGNYMRCDILWHCRLHYTRTVGSLNEKERLDLYNSVKTLCLHYLNYNDDQDDYFLIYSKEKDPYNNEVKRTKWLGRTIHYVITF